METTQRDVSKENGTLHSLNAWNRLGMWISFAVEDPGEGLGKSSPPLYFKTKLKAKGAKTKILKTRPPPPIPHLFEGLDQLFMKPVFA